MSRSAMARMVPLSIGMSYDLPVRLSTTLSEFLPAAAAGVVLAVSASVERGIGGLRFVEYGFRILQDLPAATPPRSVLIRRRMSRGRGDWKATCLRVTGRMNRRVRECSAERP